jgi:hypothetical protein
MSAATVSVSTDVIFDGNPVDWQRTLAHVSVRLLLAPNDFPTDQNKSAFLASFFRGPALDWLGQTLVTTPNALDDFEAFKTRVRNAYGLDAATYSAQCRTQLAALKQKGDLMEFFAQFEGLCAVVGTNSDVSKITLLLPKLEPYYHQALITSGGPLNTYANIKAFCANLYAHKADQTGPSDKLRKKAKCGKCGKKGHTAGQCRSTN